MSIPLDRESLDKAIEAIRNSERLTAADYAVTINARDDDRIPGDDSLRGGGNLCLACSGPFCPTCGRCAWCQGHGGACG